MTGLDRFVGQIYSLTEPDDGRLRTAVGARGGVPTRGDVTGLLDRGRGG